MDPLTCGLIFGAGIIAALVLVGIALAGWIHNASLTLLEESEYEGRHRAPEADTNASGTALACDLAHHASSVASPIAVVTNHRGNSGH